MAKKSDPQHHHFFTINNTKVLVASIVASIGYLQVEFGTGYPSPVAKEILSSGLLDTYTYSFFSSSHLLAVAIGNLIAFPLLKHFGRKCIILTNSLLTSIGWMLIVSGYNSALLIGGRIVTGFSMGIWETAVPIYLGEISPPNLRGFFSSFQTIALQFGIATVYFFGILVDFRWLAVIGVALSFIQGLLMISQPNSPT